MNIEPYASHFCLKPNQTHCYPLREKTYSFRHWENVNDALDTPPVPTSLILNLKTKIVALSNGSMHAMVVRSPINMGTQIFR